MQLRDVSMVASRRGVASLAIAFVLALLAVVGEGGTGLLLLPVWLALGWIGAWVWERLSERRPGPKPSPFSRRQWSGGMRTMLRQDHNGQFLTDSRGFLFRKRIWFEATGCPPVRIPNDVFERWGRAQLDTPVRITVAGNRRYWWWENSFYWENEGYEPRDVQALLTRTRRQKERSLQHAHALLAGEKPRKRDPVPEDVRHFVWQRDGGQCQECGSAERLQYDHLIPWSLGGADTAENLRLLCADCNRLKSDSI